MMRPRTIRVSICIVLAAGSIGLVPACHAADDTARFSGKWKTSFVYNGQTVTMVSIHQGSGFRNYVLLPNGAMPAGAGTFSAIDGKWTASSAAPNNTGTYRFAGNNAVACTNAVGQAVVWQRDNTPLPQVITAPPPAADNQQLLHDRKAADAGDAPAMYRLGLMYQSGDGVPQDYRQALLWYQKSAAAGNAAAANSIGLFYGTGLGVPIDYRQAMGWYRKAAAEGNADAMRNIGILYWDGKGVPVDRNLAVYWARKAAAAGQTQSQEWLRENGLSESAPVAGPATRR